MCGAEFKRRHESLWVERKVLGGALLVVIMKNVASAYIERWNFVLGAIFVLIVLFMPEGLVPGTARLWRWAPSASRSRTPATLPAPGASRTPCARWRCVASTSRSAG